MDNIKEKCLVCGKSTLSFWDHNKFVFLKSTPKVLGDILRKKGKGYRTHFFLCYNCYGSSNSRLKLILKKRQYVIKKDFVDIQKDDIRRKIYWFTIKLDIYGDIYIIDRKSNIIIFKKIDPRNLLKGEWEKRLIKKYIKKSLL